MITESLIDKQLTCHITGKQFVGESQGCTVNYASDAQGNIYSDEGVDIAEREQLKDRSKPFCCYLNSDCSKVTGWKGNILGMVISRGITPRRRNYPAMTSVHVRDCHGGLWYGRGQGGSVYITLRPLK
jgi:hypothetical protein